jgi:hypothetical protein
MIRHIWNLVYGTNNLWTSWINAYHLKCSSLWEVKAPNTCSWNWRKLLHLRPLVRPLFQHIIGSGLNTSYGLIIGTLMALFVRNGVPMLSMILVSLSMLRLIPLSLVIFGDGLLLCQLILLK